MKRSFFNLVVLMLCIVGLSFSSKALAEEHENLETPVVPISLSEEEVSSLENLGFSVEEIELMTEEEFIEFQGLSGELTETDETFFEIVSDLEGNVLLVEEVSENEATERANESQVSDEGAFSIMATNTTETSWLRMTTTSSKLSNGNTLLKNSFKWLSSPQVALTDVVGISHSASAVKVPGTDQFSYKYTDKTGVHSLGATGTTSNSYGIAKKFNLKKIGAGTPPYNHNGYISVQVKKGNKNDIRANAYGHYTHITVGLTGAIDIKTGSISVSANLKQSKMKNTMILFNY